MCPETAELDPSSRARTDGAESVVRGKARKAMLLGRRLSLQLMDLKDQGKLRSLLVPDPSIMRRLRKISVRKTGKVHLHRIENGKNADVEVQNNPLRSKPAWWKQELPKPRQTVSKPAKPLRA
ncbi:hypothetical protein [Roseibium sp. SCP14]|uniref:hypothetical protein n=1 Tax=Roseibium sp. SCP14 TaxID=3141375 RepID=UPI0033350585